MTLWQEITWNIARAGGMSAYILLTLAVVLGLALSAQIQSASKWPRLVNNELHTFLTLLALVFTCIHMLAVWIDPFTHFGLNEILIPLASSYRPVWMALGIVAFYLGIAIGISTWIRPIIGYQWWRRLHVLTLLIFALVTVHGLATGTDTTQWWTLGIYIVSVLLVGGLLIKRLVVPTTARGRSHPVLAVATAGVLVLGCVWALLGPLQAGWGAIAGTKAVAAASSGSSTTSSARSPSQQPSAQGEQSTQGRDPFASPFSASFQGQMTQSNTGAGGMQTVHMDTTLSNGAQGNMAIVLQGQPQNDSGLLSITATQVTLGQAANTPLYQGQIVTLRGERRWEMVALLTKTGRSSNAQQIQVQIEMHITASGQTSGYVQGTPVSGNTSSSNTPTAPNIPGGDQEDSGVRK
jgi:DMSO/TMAO reductase YedYZ heme-binding membrane subunit